MSSAETSFLRKMCANVLDLSYVCMLKLAGSSKDGRNAVFELEIASVRTTDRVALTMVRCTGWRFTLRIGRGRKVRSMVERWLTWKISSWTELSTVENFVRGQASVQDHNVDS